MGMLRALRERMRNASAQTAELKQSASSSARAKELERLVERHEQGLIPTCVEHADDLADPASSHLW